MLAALAMPCASRRDAPAGSARQPAPLAFKFGNRAKPPKKGSITGAFVDRADAAGQIFRAGEKVHPDEGSLALTYFECLDVPLPPPSATATVATPPGK